jgi:zinc D-Ala-D-Ala carboxypeptidase
MPTAKVKDGVFLTNEGTPSHFKTDELACHCCGVWEPIEQGLIDSLEKTRNELNQPIYLDCGYRCPKHNAEVDGATSSRHMMGLASDWRLEKGKSIWEAAKVAKKYFARVIIYPNGFIHTDMDDSGGTGIVMISVDKKALRVDLFLKQTLGNFS